MEELKGLMSRGNRKLPKTTAIFNLGSAKDCPSVKLGLCDAINNGVRCYARQAEYMYPNCLPYRERQSALWLSTSAESFASQFLSINERKHIKFNALRFNESGDFYSQACVDKAEKIASILNANGIKVYCYTARRDLDYSGIKSLVVNGSGFISDGITNMFKIVKRGDTKPKGFGLCVGDCRICKRCLTRGRFTGVRQH